MSEPPSPSGPSSILGYAPERRYVGSGRVTPRSLLLALGGGLVVAVLTGLAAFLWVVSRVFAIAALGGVFQGLAVGGALGWLFHRLKVRSAAAAIILGIVCGVASAGVFHACLYVRNVYDQRDQTRAELAKLGWLNDPIRQASANRILSHPFQWFDAFVIFPRTRHHGFVGYLMLRWPKIGGIAILQLLITTVAAVVIGRRTTNRPFCEDCGSWFKQPVNAAVLPVNCATALAAAVASDEPSRVYAVHNVAGSYLGSACAIARVHTCPACGKKHVDVIRSGSSRGKVLSLRRLTPEMLEALRYEKPQPVLAAEPPTVPPAAAAEG